MISQLRANPVGWKPMTILKDSDDFEGLVGNAYKMGICHTLAKLLRLAVITVDKYCELIELFKKEGCK